MLDYRQDKPQTGCFLGFVRIFDNKHPNEQAEEHNGNKHQSSELKGADHNKGNQEHNIPQCKQFGIRVPKVILKDNVHFFGLFLRVHCKSNEGQHDSHQAGHVVEERGEEAVLAGVNDEGAEVEDGALQGEEQDCACETLADEE